MGCAWQQNAFSGVTQVIAQGGHISFSEEGAGAFLALTNSTFQGGSLSASERAGPWGFDCVVGDAITTIAEGTQLFCRPNSTGSHVDACKFLDGGWPSAIHLTAGYSVMLKASVLSGSVGNAVRTANNGFIMDCQLREGADAPIASIGSGSGPIVVGCQFCANMPNLVSGPWIDAGSNTYDDVCPPDCPADLSGDGQVDGKDLAVLLSSWGSWNGDINGDGLSDGNDLGILVAAWGYCP
jgi:hypothetical protein